MKRVYAFLTGLLLWGAAVGNVTLPKLFGAHMVLQRGRPLPVWGWAAPGEKVTVQFDKQTRTAITGKDGRWMLKLDAEAAGGPYRLLVKGENSVVIDDVLVGEVWLCSGQSNMEMPIAGWGRVKNYQQEIAGADYPQIRQFLVAKAVSPVPKDDVAGGDWKVCSPLTAGDFTAAGYFFARELYKRLHVPVGLINSTWGGTMIETWISRGALESSDEFRSIMAAITPEKIEAQIRGKADALRRAVVNLQGSYDSHPDTEHWKNVDFDDTRWPMMKLPGLWEGQHLGFEDLDGLVWFRRVVMVDDADAGKRGVLKIGKVDDSDETFVNGVKVGETRNKYTEERNYVIGAGILRAGKNVIAVRVEDDGGGGGIYGDTAEMKLTVGDHTLPLAGDWRFRVEEMYGIGSGSDPNGYPTLLFNAMIRPLVPFGMRGVIWYQGEANTGRAYEYRLSFPLLIRDWRAQWGEGDLPFYYVQLSSWHGDGGDSRKGSTWAELREAQAMTLALPNTGMATTTDIGDVQDIHPKNKQEVGRRLAAIALANVYGRGGEYCGPQYESMRVDGHVIRLKFRHMGGGLVTHDSSGVLKGFEIAGADRQFYQARAFIDGDEVVVGSDSVDSPAAVRYGWADNASDANLFNKDGYPATPFRTDRWKGVTEGVKYSRIDDRQFDPSTLLWYQEAAATWEAALPVGNGRLGAMVFGRTGEERIQLNEDTYWTGGPYSTVVKGGYKMLPEVRRLVFAGKYLEAQTVFGRYLMGYPVEQQKYQCLGNLHLFFAGQPGVSAAQPPVSGYKRWLDLETGITGVQYVAGGVTFRREVFASFPDQVIVIRLTADQPGSISFAARLRGVRNQTHSNYATDYFRMDGTPDGLKLTGKSADYMGVEGRLRYEARLRAVPEGGAMKVEGDLLTISGANAVTLYVVAATNFVNYHDVSGDAHQRVEEYLSRLSGKTYQAVREAHIRDYRSLFARVSLRLPVTDVSYEPTDRRKAKVSDPALAALAYQFGRYVLIASSRPGSQPANLQGIWNDNPNPMWDSKYTTNINTEMNYWPAESGNLSECAEPLFKMIGELTDQGSQVAAEHYGCRGWVFHQNTDLWRVAAPMDGPTWGTFTVGGAWLCTHLWEHYAFTDDTAFLRRVYPILKGSVQFFLDFLVPTPDNRWLVTNPSSSPENFPDRPGNGRYFDEVIGAFLPGTNICAGSSIDMQILRDLLGQYIEAAGILRADAGMADSARRALSRLLPPRVGKDGTLQEWAEDWGQTEHPHRHLSPLYGLYPGNVFSFNKTPQLIEPCRRLLEQRGDSSAEWARAWKVALWARLHDGNHANAVLKGYLRDASNPQFLGNHGFPVQVDGTLGTAAGISEMLIQSNDGMIDLLPALPDEWSSGSFEGVCTRGAFEWGLSWDGGRITHATMLSKQGMVCRLQAHADVVVRCGGRKVRVRKLAGGVVEFPTVKGGVYDISPTRRVWSTGSAHSVR